MNISSDQSRHETSVRAGTQSLCYLVEFALCFLCLCMVAVLVVYLATITGMWQPPPITDNTPWHRTNSAKAIGFACIAAVMSMLYARDRVRIYMEEVRQREEAAKEQANNAESNAP